MAENTSGPTEPPTLSVKELENESSRLTQIFKEYNLDELVRLARRQRMSTKGDKNELVDRCVRWDLRRCFGSTVASWTIEDQDPNKLDTPYPDFNPPDILERTADERILSP